MKYLTRLSLAPAILLAGMSIAFAQPMAPGANDGQAATIARLQALRQEMQQLGAVLQQIQLQAVAATPSLNDRQEGFQSLLFSTMQEQGFDAATAFAQMNALQMRMQDANATAEQKQAMAAEFQRRSQAFQSAQAQAMQSSEVQAAQQQLESELKAAMMRIDPATEQLIAQMEAKQAAFESMVRESTEQ